MIGSETFIIVAFMCNENSRSRSRASSISLARNWRSADRLITDASTTSPCCNARPSLRTVVSPAAFSITIFTEPAAAIT